MSEVDGLKAAFENAVARKPGTWLFKCVCGRTWTAYPNGRETRAPHQHCPRCERDVKAGF
jgi:hypothetical protein